MTDRERHLSLALDALVILEERLKDLEYRMSLKDYLRLRRPLMDVKRNIEAAAMPKPSIIRRLFRKEAA